MVLGSGSGLDFNPFMKFVRRIKPIGKGVYLSKPEESGPPTPTQSMPAQFNAMNAAIARGMIKPLSVSGAAWGQEQGLEAALTAPPPAAPPPPIAPLYPGQEQALTDALTPGGPPLPIYKSAQELYPKPGEIPGPEHLWSKRMAEQKKLEEYNLREQKEKALQDEYTRWRETASPAQIAKYEIENIFISNKINLPRDFTPLPKNPTEKDWERYNQELLDRLPNALRVSKLPVSEPLKVKAAAKKPFVEAIELFETLGGAAKLVAEGVGAGMGKRGGISEESRATAQAFKDFVTPGSGSFLDYGETTERAQEQYREMPWWQQALWTLPLDLALTAGWGTASKALRTTSAIKKAQAADKARRLSNLGLGHLTEHPQSSFLTGTGMQKYIVRPTQAARDAAEKAVTRQEADWGRLVRPDSPEISAASVAARKRIDELYGKNSEWFKKRYPKPTPEELKQRVMNASREDYIPAILDTIGPKELETGSIKYFKEFMGAQGFNVDDPEVLDRLHKIFIAEPVAKVADSMTGGGTFLGALHIGSYDLVHVDEYSPEIVALFNKIWKTNIEPRDIADMRQAFGFENSGATHYHASPECKRFSRAHPNSSLHNIEKIVNENDRAIAMSVARNLRTGMPATFSLENVPAYGGYVDRVKGVWSETPEKRAALLNIITDTLDELGYKWDMGVYNAADYGGSQDRKRLILRAVRGKKDEFGFWKYPELPGLPERIGGTDWYTSLRYQIEAAKSAGAGKLVKDVPRWNEEKARIIASINKGKLSANEPIITTGAMLRGNHNARQAGRVGPTLTVSGKKRIILPDPQGRGFEYGIVIDMTPEMQRIYMGLPDSYRVPKTTNELTDTIFGNGIHGIITRGFLQPLVDMSATMPKATRTYQREAAEGIAARQVVEEAPDVAARAAATIMPTEIKQDLLRIREAVDQGVARARESLAQGRTWKDDHLGMPTREPDDFRVGFDDIDEAEGGWYSEMRRRGVNLTEDNGDIIGTEIRHAQDAAGLSDIAPGKADSFIYDIIAKRHGGKAISDTDEVLSLGRGTMGGPRPTGRLAPDRFNVDWEAQGYAEIGEAASRDARQLLDEADEILYGSVGRAAVPGFVAPLGDPAAGVATMVPQSGPAKTGLFDMLGALQAERAGIQSRGARTGMQRPLPIRMPRLSNILGDTGTALNRTGRNILNEFRERGQWGGGYGGRRGGIIDSMDSSDGIRSEMGSNFVNKLLDANVRGNNARDLLRRLSNQLAALPDTTIKGRTVGLGAFLRTLINSSNPSAIIERSPIRMEGLGYMLLEEFQGAQASQRLSALARSPFKKVIGDDGKITLLDKRRVEFGDVAQDMNKYAPFLTREQREWIEAGHELLDDMVRLYEKSTGKEFPKLEMGQGMRYWPRWIETKGKYTAARGKVGAKAGILKKRFYDLQEDGVKGGVNYKKDPLEQVELYVHAIHKMIRDEVFVSRITKRVKGEAGPLGPSGIDRRLARRPGPGDWDVIRKRKLAEQGEVMPDDYFQLRNPAIFRKEDWKELQAFLPKLQRADLTNFEKLNKYAGSVSSLLRTLQAGAFDLGQFTIQGSILFFRSPIRWSKAVHGAFRAMIDPDFYMHWRQYSPESQLASKYGIDLGLTSEFFESGLLQSRVGAPIRPFQRSFETFIGMGRAYMFDGFAQTASRKASGNALEEELMRLARYTDTMLGVTSSRALGVSATQRSIENAWVFFSPRYTRSLFGVFSNTLAGGRVGVEARRALGQTLIGGALTYWGIGKAMGKSDEELLRGLNPLNGKRFLSYEIGGRWYGIGGGLRSMMTLMAAPLDTDNWKNTVTGKFIYDWLRMRQPPVASSLMDYLGGDTPMGVPMSSFFGEEWKGMKPNKELLDYAQSKVLPFPIQAAYEMWGEEVPILSKEMATAVGTEFLGGRTSGETFTDAANDEARALGWPEYRDAEPWQKAHLEQLERTKAAKEKRERYGLGGTIDDIESRFEAELQQIEADLSLGNRVSEKAAVNKYYEEIGEMSKQKMGARMHEHGPGMGYREGDTPGEKALNEFFNIGRNEGEGKDYYDPDYQTEQQNAFMKQLRMSDLEAYEYVLRNTNIDYLGNLLGSKSKLRRAVEYHSSTGTLARAKASRNARNKWKAENR